MANSARQWLFRIGKWGVVLGAITYLVAADRLNFSDFRLQPGAVPILSIGLLPLLLGLVVSVLRWFLLLRCVDVPLSFRRTARIGFIGLFFNTFLFGGIGGDAVKLGYLFRLPSGRAAGAASVVTDRTCGLLGLFILGGAAIALGWEHVNTPDLRLLGAVLFGILATVALSGLVAFLSLLRGRTTGLLVVLVVTALLAVWLLTFPSLHQNALYMHYAMLTSLLVATVTANLVPSLLPGAGLHSLVSRRVPGGASLMRLVEGFLVYRHHPGGILFAVVLSVVVHGSILASLAAVSHAMGNPATVAQIFFAAPLALVANVLPLPMGGLGVGENFFDQTLALMRGPSGNPLLGGAAVFLSFRVVLNLGQIGLGLPFYLRSEAPAPAVGTDFDNPTA